MKKEKLTNKRALEIGLGRPITYYYLKCSFCGKELIRDKHSLRKRQKNQFCNQECFAGWKKQAYVAEGNPNFVAYSPKRAAGQWERNRLLALERDNYCCVKCGSKRKVDVHHKKPWHPDDLDPHALENLESLCRGCHSKEHFSDYRLGRLKEGLSLFFQDPVRVQERSEKIWKTRREL